MQSYLNSVSDDYDAHKDFSGFIVQNKEDIRIIKESSYNEADEKEGESD
jgi:hypothetical protein